MRRLLSLAVVLGVGAALLPGGYLTADASSSYTFHGSGYGHGLGMSQYGALGLARKGWPAGKIVRHYYTDTTVKKQPPLRGRIRVGLLPNQQDETVVIAVGGSYDLVLAKTGKVVDTVPADKRRRIRVTEDKKFEIVKTTGKVVDTVGGPNNDLIVQFSDRVRLPAWGHEVGRGTVQFDIAGSGSAHVVAEMPVHRYVFGIAEVPSSWPAKALRAQAIASRTFAYWRMGLPRTGCSCDILATTADQYWIGWDKEAATGGASWVAAVNDTRRKVVLHGGTPIYAVYGSSSGGHTERIKKVWPAAQALPYLKAVCDPEDDVPENPSTTWEVSLSATHVTDQLKPYTGSIGTVTGFSSFDRGVSGRVTTVEVVGTSGSAVVRGWDVRVALGLKDTRFAVDENLNITAKIRTKYDRIDCKPKRAVTPQRDILGGKWQGFTKGRLYLNASLDRVVWVRGRVLTTYVELGAHTSSLGLPVKFKKFTGGATGTFEGGTITCGSGCSVSYS